MTYDIIIIGSGPAGLTAGVYAGRGNFKTLILEGMLPGGQLMTTTYVENWPGDESVLGPDLMERMRNHAKKYGAELIQDPVVAVDFKNKPFKLTTESGAVYQAHSVIIATGAHHKKLNVPGEMDYFAKGVSTCATCDAPFYRDKDVIIAGGGNSAVTEAEHLLKFVKSLTIVQNLDKLTATDPIKEKVINNPRVRFVFNSVIKEIKGDGNHITEVITHNTVDNSIQTIATNGLFIAIGLEPGTKLFKDHIELDKFGYVVLHGHTQTSVPGVFAAGDVADYRYRQAITSAGAGCQAALDAQEYLARND